MSEEAQASQLEQKGSPEEENKEAMRPSSSISGEALAPSLDT